MSSATLRVAVIGAGPSGFYAADALLKQHQGATVDVFDRLPTPYGLVRYGVAPDHQKIKSVTKVFDRLVADPRLRLLCNVQVGRDIGIKELRRHYHALIFSYGAAADRPLGVPGEDLAGSISATDFVAWYNGHPDKAAFEPPLDARHAVVVGMGNVAVDVTRVLSKTPAELADSDAADHALAALARSQVRDVYVLGRRSPAEAKWTTKELRELGELADADVVLDPAELELLPQSLAAIEADPAAMKNLEVLRDFAQRPLSGKPRRIHLRFLVSPVALESDDGVRVSHVVLERNRLEPQADGSLRAVGSGEFERLPAQLVLRSVGYLGRPLEGLPFDERRGVVPNRAGRVLSETGGEALPGMYVAGWIKRGPTGVIGTNKADAAETVATLLGDELPSPRADGPADLGALLAERGVRVVDADCWRRIDALETQAGAAVGRPRVKLVTVEAMLEAAGLAASGLAAEDAVLDEG